MIRVLAVSSALCIAAACAKSSSSTTATPATPSSTAPSSTRRSSTLITTEELANTTAKDVRHAIQLLRPDWLRSRGSTSMRSTTPTEAVVYVNGQRYGGLGTLEQFQPSAVKELRYISASEATNRFGTGHNGGAILVTTK